MSRSSLLLVEKSLSIRRHKA